MQPDPVPVFDFAEGDHLTRIHLKLGLEDLGFAVVEDGHVLKLIDPSEPNPPSPSAA
jgi:hypothetical protein